MKNLPETGKAKKFPGKVEIRKAGWRDLKEILALHRRYFHYPSFFFWLLLAFLPGGEALAAVDQGKARLAGYIISFRNRITEICVDEKFQKQGLGKKLIGKSKVSSFKDIVVLTANKFGAVSFYEKIGFKVVGKKGKVFKLKYSKE